MRDPSWSLGLRIIQKRTLGEKLFSIACPNARLKRSFEFLALTVAPTAKKIASMERTKSPAVSLIAIPDYRSDTRTWPYDNAVGARIADRLSWGESIFQQHIEDPLTIPPPSVVLTWKKQHPHFGQLMAHADKVRAQLLVEQALVLADTGTAPPARIALQIAQRMKMAEKADPALWGSGAASGGDMGRLGSDPQPVAPALSDDELAALAAQGQPAGSGA
jgi:hypothetical protein